MITEKAVNGQNTTQIQQQVTCVCMNQVAGNNPPKFTMQDRPTFKGKSAGRGGDIEQRHRTDECHQRPVGTEFEHR